MILSNKGNEEKEYARKTFTENPVAVWLAENGKSGLCRTWSPSRAPSLYG